MYVGQELLVPLRRFLGLPLSITLMGLEPPLRGLPASPSWSSGWNWYSTQLPGINPIIGPPPRQYWPLPQRLSGIDKPCWLPLCFSKLSAPASLPSHPGFPQIPGSPSLVSVSRCPPARMGLGLGFHPCLAHNAASDKLPDPDLGWGLPVQNQLAGYLLCTCFGHQRETLGRSVPHSWELCGVFCFLFLFFKVIFKQRNLPGYLHPESYSLGNPRTTWNACSINNRNGDILVMIVFTLYFIGGFQKKKNPTKFSIFFK